MLDYNSYLIQGFQDYINKDVNGLIQSYRNVLSLLEKTQNPQIEHLITAKCNLAVAHFYNSENQEALNYLKEALDHFNPPKKTGWNRNALLQSDKDTKIEFQSFERQSLYLKCKCNLMIILFSTNDESGYKQVLFDITNLMNNL